jgi:hypothetical protein
MQNVITPELGHPAETPAQRALTIPVELLAYILLAVFALALRLMDTGAIPLATTEIHNALAAWRAASVNASGDPLVSHSPLLFLLQASAFTVFGGTELAARFGVIVAGTFLVLSPVLFRRWIGAGNAFIFSFLLALSPTLLAASRFGSPVVLSFAIGAIFLWALWRYIETRGSGYGITLIVSASALVFLTERGGILLLMLLLASAWIAHWLTKKADQAYNFDNDLDAAQPSSTSASLIRGISWEWALPVSLLVVFGVATCFLLYPSGLSAIGESLSGTLEGFVQRPSYQPTAYPLLISWYYEPFLWVFAVISVIVLARRGTLTLADRFLAIWAVLGAVLSGIFIGGEAAHALWTVIPLTGLVARFIGELLRMDTDPASWGIPYWARFVVALITLALLTVFVLALQDTARAMTQAQAGVLATVPLRPASLIMLVVTPAFAVVALFMGATVWSMRTVLRGAALALLAFTSLTSLGAGWRLSTTEAGNPREYWHLSATHRDTALLRETLLELGDRESRGFTLVPLSVAAEQDGIVAWLVRDFSNAEFITDMAEARGQGIVLVDADIEPDLGGPYVGQDFTVRSTWNVNALPLTDMLGWWTQNKLSFDADNAIDIDTAYLWLRQDVWQGTEQDQPGIG